jgi:pyridoxamine 5'-phosphate oxidase
MNGLNMDLTDIEKDCWLRLLNGSLKSKDSLHNPVVANTSKEIINMRTVVLRNVNTKNKTLAFHTDIRSGKWNELQQNNNISWLFYDAPARFQIRLGGKVTLHQNDSIADEAWLKSNANSRKVYLATLAPSSKTDIPTSGLPAVFESNNPSLEETELGRKNFGIVVTKALWMEWLWLNSAGHRRAEFTYKEDGNFDANWVIP